MSISYCATDSIKSQSSNGGIHAYSAYGKRITGIIRDSTFIKSDWHSTSHLCHKHKAISMWKATFLQYILPFATVIVVPDNDSGREYTATTKDFREYAIEDNKGRKIKLCLPLLYWSIIEPDGTKSTQLRLFSIKQLELMERLSKGKRA